jgi:hypothetical protein
MVTIEHIDDEDNLYRRIPQYQYNEKADKIFYCAFKDYELSVDWEKCTTPQKTLEGHPNFHLASIKAKFPRTKGQVVEHSPSKRNKAHSLVKGKKTNSIQRFLRDNSKLIFKQQIT